MLWQGRKLGANLHAQEAPLISWAQFHSSSIEVYYWRCPFLPILFLNDFLPRLRIVQSVSF
ncbi:ORF1252 [White spot syndrome virus]|uniref:ORF1252 n=1 Tax=White spot syndrome virus TaxID=342409 RepID=A0A2D3I736_9VIRU|nr:ORF1252 [White spot syndrome virus]